MTDQNQNRFPVSEFPGSKDDLDRALDAALAKYAAVEPRAGLEGRILARVGTEQARPADSAWLSGWRWRWAASVTAVFVVTLALAWSWRAHWQSVTQNHPMATTPRQKIANKPVNAEVAARNENPAITQGRMAAGPAFPSPQAHPSRNRSSAAEAAVSAYPKLDRFPSPRPLTDEERALRRYVQDFPQEALLTALAQEASEIEMQQKMNAVEPANSEQER
jgi:hypothetical protein